MPEESVRQVFRRRFLTAAITRRHRFLAQASPGSGPRRARFPAASAGRVRLTEAQQQLKHLKLRTQLLQQYQRWSCSCVTRSGVVGERRLKRGRYPMRRKTKWGRGTLASASPARRSILEQVDKLSRKDECPVWRLARDGWSERAGVRWAPRTEVLTPLHFLLPYDDHLTVALLLRANAESDRSRPIYGEGLRNEDVRKTQRAPGMADHETGCYVCGLAASLRCSACRQAGIAIHFCSQAHQKLASSRLLFPPEDGQLTPLRCPQVWKTHKLVCGPGKANPFKAPPVSEKEMQTLREVADEDGFLPVTDPTRIMQLMIQFGKPMPSVIDCIEIESPVCFTSLRSSTVRSLTPAL